MNPLQETITYTYIAATIMICLSHCFFKNHFISKSICLLTRFSLIVYLSYIIFPAESTTINPSHIIITFVGTFIADICFTLKRDAIAVGFFILSYIMLAFTFSTHLIIHDLLYGLPFFMIFILIFILLRHLYLQTHKNFSRMFTLGAIVFGFFLSLAVCSLITTGHRGFSLPVTIMASSAGIILFISDLFVAYNIVKDEFIVWLKNSIWITYMIGWTLILLIIADSSITKF